MKRAIYIAILCLLVVGRQMPAHADTPSVSGNYILLLNSANFGESWSDVILESLVKGISRQGVEVKTDILQVPKMRTLDDAEATLDMLRDKYPVPPRVVIFIGDPGWLVTRPLFDSEWKEIPTLICYSRSHMPVRTEDLLSGNLNNQTMALSEQVTAGYNLTVLRQPSFVRETVEAMRQLLPRMQRVAFISDHRYISLRVREEVAETMQESFPDLKLEQLSSQSLTTEELLDELAECDETVGLIYYSWFVTENRSLRSYLDDNVQKVLFAFTRTPIFSIADRTTEAGDFAGGYYIAAADFAPEVIATVERILSGTQARDIPWRDGGAPALHLDYAHLQRHNVSTSLFPEQAIYTNVPPGFWEKYKFQVIAGMLFLLFVLVGGVLWLRILMLRQMQLRRENSFSTRYRRLIDNMPVIYIRRKPIGGGRDFIFENVNTAFEKIFRCSFDAVVGRKLSDLLSSYPQLSNMDSESDIFMLPNGESNRYFQRLTFSSCEPGVHDIFCIERTEEYLARLEMEEHNRERENLNEKYKIVLRATGLTPWTWDKHTELIDCDFEYTSDVQEMENNRLIVPADLYYAVIHPDDCERIRQAYDDLHAGRTSILQEEYRVLFLPDETQYVWTKSFAVVQKRDEEGKPVLIVGASVKIESQKALEQDLREAKEKAEESNRLKSAFLANMSHEIRTPLNAIVGFSELLSTTEDADERKEYTHLVEENNDLLLKLISDILDLSKIEAGTFEFHYGVVDVNQMCEEIMRALDLKIKGRSLDLRFDTHKPQQFIYSDKNRLTQVLTNFLTNALKFTVEGFVSLDYQVVDGQICFRVEDTGRGVSKEQQAMIFERFVKLDSFAQGTGLGLSICKSIIEQMGGQIGVESAEGRGSCFWFSVPTGEYDMPEENEPETQLNSPVVKLDGQRPVVLVAEDVESNYRLVMQLLEKEFEVVRARNGAEAVQLCAAQPFDAILMDINMPVMDGLEATRQIRQNNSIVPIIAVTANAFDQDRQRALDAGCNDYLAKPLKRDQLKLRLRSVIVKRS